MRSSSHPNSRPAGSVLARTRFKTLLLLLAASGFGAAGAAEGAIVVTGSVSFNPATLIYSYSYSVSNTSLTEDGILISIPVDPVSQVMGAAAPAGFSLQFDPSQGWVNFVEDGSIVTPQMFSPGSVVQPFNFDSPYAPQFVTYLAYDTSGTEFQGRVQSPVPEPSASMLGALAALPALMRRRRK